MATPKKLDFSSPVYVDSDDTSPPSPSYRRRSLRKPTLKRSSSEAVREEETKKKKMKINKKLSSSSVINRIWNEEDELAILKGLVDYRAKTGLQPNTDWDAFFGFVRGSINVEVSKEQLLSKIRKLKGKFLLNLKKINQGNDPHFTRSTDSEAFGFSMMIWGKNEAEFTNVDMQSESGDDEVANAEPLTENVAAKSNFDGKSHHEKERHADADDDDDDDDELCGLLDAFETMMSQGLRDYQKKLMLEKLMNLANGKRKELSDEWKALCFEEVKLNIKKLRFSAKLAEAANDR